MTKQVTFEKIVGGGKALGYLDGKPCFAAGPLPGEVCDVVVKREKAGFAEANVARIVQPVAERSLPAEDHYLECSPWQNVVYDRQLELKRAMLAEAYSGPKLHLPVTAMTGAKKQIGYRNKLEFSLRKGEHVDLAFHARGSYEELVVLPEGCRLGSEAINKAALAIAGRIEALKLAGYVETVTVRQSVANGGLLGVVALHQVPKRAWDDLGGLGLAGLVVTRVRHRDAHELVWHDGELQLEEKIAGLNLAYPYDGFFQTNPPAFEDALAGILAAIPKGANVVDLYGGVGSIGLAVAGRADSVVGVEVNLSSVEWSLGNADRNGIVNYTAVHAPAERLEAKVLRGADCVIVDPPRAGLHGRVIDSLLEAGPARIVYLSCNPATQVRDVQLLSEAYRAQGVDGFDFYPGTLHLESLVVLDRI